MLKNKKCTHLTTNQKETLNKKPIPEKQTLCRKLFFILIINYYKNNVPQSKFTKNLGSSSFIVYNIRKRAQNLRNMQRNRLKTNTET